MKKVIVLGANGQLGLTIKDLANIENHEFFFFSRSDSDITDKKNLAKTFKLLRPDYCINCAAYTNVEAAEENIEAAFLVNAEGVKNIAEVCHINAVKLMHISTDYVFDGNKGKPYSTTDKTLPINQYGKSKLKGEFYIQEELNEYHIIRTSWLYSLYGKNFLKTIISKVNNGDSLTITTEEEGTPTSCVDLAEFILYIIRVGAPYGIYNFSARGSTTWFGFAQEIVRGYNPKRLHQISSIEKFKTKAKRPKQSIFDLSKTENVYKPIRNWKESVTEVVENYKKRHN